MNASTIIIPKQKFIILHKNHRNHNMKDVQ